jgi:hypothetical protein
MLRSGSLAWVPSVSWCRRLCVMQVWASFRRLRGSHLHSVLLLTVTSAALPALNVAAGNPLNVSVGCPRLRRSGMSSNAASNSFSLNLHLLWVVMASRLGWKCDDDGTHL